MSKKKHVPDLREDRLKKSPFDVPAGYFEAFPERIRERIRSEEAARIPERRIGHTRGFRAALAAAVVGVALISYMVLTRLPSGGSGTTHPDIALLEQMEVLEDTDYVLELLEEDVETTDEEAYINQAMEYLAIHDVELDLIFE